MNVKVLALDLERTLIDDALSGRPRPGLFNFLAFCHERFSRVAMFTTVEEADAREAMTDLDRAGHLPPGLLDRLEFVGWSGEFKDLTFVPGAAINEVVLVDDDAGWVRRDQRDQWVPVAAWDGGPDTELARVQVVLEGRLTGSVPKAEPGAAAADGGA
ncbi:NIF family HAD-type phosphatase [Fimbriiglobus ruber]|nr:NIF family HAD-type phosphatase [Fimbriiglobus ruber]